MEALTKNIQRKTNNQPKNAREAQNENKSQFEKDDALRVPPAVTRLTVYRRLQVQT